MRQGQVVAFADLDKVLVPLPSESVHSENVVFFYFFSVCWLNINTGYMKIITVTEKI